MSRTSRANLVVSPPPVRGEVLMGDVFDGVRFRRARIRLP